jgi:hypothetical protein
MSTDQQPSRRNEVWQFAAAFIGAASAAVGYAIAVPPRFELIATNYETLSRLNDRDWWEGVVFMAVLIAGMSIAVLGWIIVAERRLPGSPRLLRRNGPALVYLPAWIAAWIVPRAVSDALPHASGLYVTDRPNVDLHVVAPADMAQFFVVSFATLVVGLLITRLVTDAQSRRGAVRDRGDPDTPAARVPSAAR